MLPFEMGRSHSVPNSLIPYEEQKDTDHLDHLGGSWVLVSRVVSSLEKLIAIVTLPTSLTFK